MKKDLHVAPKPDPENPLIRALRMSAARLRAHGRESGRIALFDAARLCDGEIEREIGRMRAAGEASS